MNREEFQFPPYLPMTATCGHCRIVATGCTLPDYHASNRDIAEKFGLKINPAVIAKMIGVQNRHIAQPETCDTDLMVDAARQALQRAHIQPDQLKKIIVNKFVGDRLLPMTASFLQDKLGMSRAVHSFDIDGGLHAAFQAIDLIAKLHLDDDEYVLLVSGGINNRLIQRGDARHAFLFGDGAGALLFGSSRQRQVLGAYQMTNTSFDHLGRSFVFKDIDASKLEKQNQKFFYDLYTVGDWNEAAAFVTQAVAHSWKQLSADTAVTPDAIDGVILGCFTKKVEQAVVEGLAVVEDKCISRLGECGNTLSATLPLAIAAAVQQDYMTPGKTLLFVSVGEGLSVGLMLYRC